MTDSTQWNGYRGSNLRKFWHGFELEKYLNLAVVQCPYFQMREPDWIKPNAPPTLSFCNATISWV